MDNGMLTQRPFRDLKMEPTVNDSQDAMLLFNKIRKDCYKCISVAHDVIRDIKRMEAHYQAAFPIKKATKEPASGGR